MVARPQVQQNVARCRDGANVFKARPENCHMPYYVAALPNLQKALARKRARRTANDLLPYFLSFLSYS